MSLNFNLPCGRERCIGKACGNWNDPADKFGNPKREVKEHPEYGLKVTSRKDRS